ncbi:FkbM family methyltransferase (plasmid) [Rhizobium sp. CB3060]|uniref:FkbM family methyltransferase n=1 Tax=Rhizobium sp. CB3060 TaxID=3138255 RepID=UPI0021A7D1E8|nr:FkbM family methyltransferase [Rhizobium tropici]UWU23547.1 FkbM family methyltransferase [Rhizobium tropici]
MFVSYAQNFEDVILWRALKQVKNGFYIDIGAQDPVVESVSRGFYENGWRGIHAEATTHYAEKVRQDRPDENVIQAAIGSGDGSIRFFEVQDTGLSTSDPDFAMKHKAAGHSIVETDVPLMPLSAVFAQAGDREVHWLKVDVEGMEASVIESWAPSPARPWVVVMESTLPNSQETNYEQWEPKLLDMGYQFAYFDGLSRFYVSEQHKELLHFFGPGPNVFDGFVLADKTPYTAVLRLRLAERDQQLERAHTEHAHQMAEMRRIVQEDDRRIRTLEGELSASRNREAIIGAQLHETYQSLSWRLTRPLRKINALKAGLLRLPRHGVKILLEKIIRWLSRHPQWKDRCLQLLYRYPKFRGKLEAFARSRGYGVTQHGLDVGHEAEWYIDAPKGASAQWKQLLEDIPAKSER